MKIIFFIILSIVSTVVCANEVVTINGQRVALLKLETIRSIDLMFKNQKSEAVIAEGIHAILKKEMMYISGQESFCDTAMKIYGSRNSTPANVKQKCIALLSSKYLPKELAQDPPEYKSLKEFQMALSQYVALLILME